MTAKNSAIQEPGDVANYCMARARLKAKWHMAVSPKAIPFFFLL
jgi:hypothetical protein